MALTRLLNPYAPSLTRQARSTWGRAGYRLVSLHRARPRPDCPDLIGTFDEQYWPNRRPQQRLRARPVDRRPPRFRDASKGSVSADEAAASRSSGVLTVIG